MTTIDYDVVIIGGGIQGVGIAQASAAAGYRCLVIEQRGLAAGTSSRSSKLIHGGLRYLETLQLSLVREALRERRILLENAPELVHLVPFHVPIFEDSTRRPWLVRAGLSLYALLGGLSRANGFRSVPRQEWAQLDGLRTDGLDCVFEYKDAQTDDAALTRAVMRSAEELGAELACPATFQGATRHTDTYRVSYDDARGDHEVSTRTLVNAAGPWVSRVLSRIEPTPLDVPIDLVGGSHITVDGTLERGVYYTESPEDQRAVLIMPWQGNTLVGTTEVAFDGDPASVKPTDDEVAYLLRTLQHCFPDHAPTELERFAGLRVLPRATGGLNRRSRETILQTDGTRPARLLTVVGGKLTTYRSTSQKALQKLRPALPSSKERAQTSELRLSPDPQQPLLSPHSETGAAKP